MRERPKLYSDEEIVSMLMGRNMLGITVLYDQYGGYLLGMVSEIVKIDEFSEMTLQNAFLKIWNKIDTYNVTRGRFFTWILNITRNAAIDTIRSKNYKQSIKLIGLDTVSQHPVNIGLDAKVENLDIKDIVLKLDKKYSELIYLIYFKGYTHIEVAEELNIPLGTVKSRVRKAFKDLRDILG